MKQIFESLTKKQILSIVIVAACVIAGLISLSHWNQERDFRPYIVRYRPKTLRPY